MVFGSCSLIWHVRSGSLGAWAQYVDTTNFPFKKISSVFLFTVVKLNDMYWYIFTDLLGRFKLWTISNDIIKMSYLPQISMMNQQSTRIPLHCSVCNKALQRVGWLCDRCKAVINTCALWWAYNMFTLYGDIFVHFHDIHVLVIVLFRWNSILINRLKILHIVFH